MIFHDTFFWESPEDYNKYWLRYFKWLVKMGLRGNAKILTVSETSMQRLEKLSITDKPLAYVHTSYQRRLPVAKDKAHPVPYFLHVGVLEKRKNLPLLIEAYAHARKKHTDMPDLVFIGQKGPKKDLDDAERIFESIESHSLQEHVHWLDYVDEQLLSDYYAGAMAYVFPSRNEGFGLPVLEAFSFNIPVIISDQEALVEIAHDAAYIVSPSSKDKWVEALVGIATEVEVRQSFISKGKVRLSHFNRSTFASKLIAEISA